MVLRLLLAQRDAAQITGRSDPLAQDDQQLSERTLRDCRFAPAMQQSRAAVLLVRNGERLEAGLAAQPRDCSISSWVSRKPSSVRRV
jgi:hypothetical protein